MLEPIEMETDDDFGIQLLFDVDNIIYKDLKEIIDHYYPERRRENVVVTFDNNKLFLHEE